MKKVKVAKDICIGCGACQAIVPDVFEIGDDGLAQVILKEDAENEVEQEINEEDVENEEEKFVEVPTEFEEDVMDAAEGCPTNAIKVVKED